jgi:toxin ParE1/3/4
MIPRVSPEAEADLDEMEAWLTENWGPLAAANLIEAVLQRIAALADMPFTGAPRPEYGESVRFVTAGRYVIYYEADEDALTVMRILHAARDRESIMRMLAEGEDKK